MLELFNVLLENCKVASCFFLALMLVRPLTEKFFSQSWHYLAFRVNLLLFFLPIRWLSEGIAPLLVKIFPSPTIGEVTQQTELAPNFTITWGEQIVGESQQFTQANSIDWTGLLVSTWYPIWVLVAVGLFFWKTYCFVRFQREVKGLSAIQCPVIQKFFQKCKELMGFTGAIPLLGSENIYSPVLLGLHQPKILLPIKKMQEKHLEYIFIHELTHLRRKDLWWKALLTPLTILYWWNPLIYLFSRQFKNVLEYSCDEEVVKLRSHEERKCYGKAILESIDEEKTNPVLGVSFRTPEQLLEMRLIKMLKFSEMKTRTKVLSGVLMCSMLLGAAAPSMANAMAKNQVTYDDPWDMPAKTGTSINTLISVNSEDEENFTKDEWAEIMKRVEAGTIEYVEITEEHRELEAFLKKHNIPPFMTSAPNELSLPSLTVGEKLALFQYYVENDCTGNILCAGDINETTGEYEITTSCYNREGDLIVSHDLGETWEVKDHITGGASRTESDLSWAGMEVTPIDTDNSKVIVFFTDELSSLSEKEAEFYHSAIFPMDDSKYSQEEWTALMYQVLDGEIPILLPPEAKSWVVTERGISWSSEEDTKFSTFS